MAGKNNAIGILFGVLGGGDVGGASYNEINEKLDLLVANINKRPKLIKFSIDDADLANKFNKITESINAIAGASKIEKEAAKGTEDIVNKSAIAYERIAGSAKRYREALEAIEKLSAGKKGFKPISVDENGKVYGTNKKSVDIASNYNTAKEYFESSMSDESLKDVSASQRDELIEIKNAIEKQFIEVSKSLYKTSSSKMEAKSSRMEAAKFASSLRGQYLDALRDAYDNGDVKFEADSFIPTDETEEAKRRAESLVKIRAEMNESVSQISNKKTRESIFGTYAEEISELEKNLSGFKTAADQEEEELDEETKKRKEARQALIALKDAYLEVLKAKGRGEQIDENGINGELSVSNYTGNGTHIHKLEEALENANEASRKLFDSLSALNEEDKKQAVGSGIFRKIVELKGQITAEIPDAIKEIESLLPQIESGYVKEITRAIGLGDDNAVKGLLEKIKKTALNLSGTEGGGQEYADKFLRAMYTRLKKLKNPLIEEFFKGTGTDQKIEDQQKTEQISKEKVRSKKEEKKAQDEVNVSVKEELDATKKVENAEESKTKKKKRNKKETADSTAESQKEKQAIEEQLKVEEQVLEVKKKETEESKKQAQQENAETSNKKEEAPKDRTAALINDFAKVYKSLDNASMRTSTIRNNPEALEAASQMIQRYSELRRELEKLGISFSTNSKGMLEATGTGEQYTKNLDLIKRKVYDVNKAHTDSVSKVSQSWAKNANNARDYIDTYGKIADRFPEISDKIEKIEKTLAAPEKDLEKLRSQMADLMSEVAAKGGKLETWWQSFTKKFSDRVKYMVAAFVTGSITRYLREIYTNVSNVDAALTQLKIVTRASDDRMNTFFKNAVSQAKELGAAVTDVLKQMETFSRLGYNLEDSSILSKYATILSNVAGVSSEEATKGLTSIIKGFNFDVSQTEHISDVLIKVGQEYAVSASELMEAYEKAGAALHATGTSYEKSAALIAAANAAVQDSSVVGTALKTISARIRKSKTDLDELGESMDDLAGSISAYASEIKNLTGFNILVEGTTDTYKDLYDIFLGLSKGWNDLSETSQARVAEILGGTRQYQVISSILSNMGDAMGAYSSAMDSIGESSRANGIYVDSIAGRIAQLKSSFTELSTTILSSNLVNVVVNALKFIVNVLDSILGLADGLPVKIALIVSAIALLSKVVTDTKNKVGLLYKIIQMVTVDKTGFFGLLIPKVIKGLKDFGLATIVANTKAAGLKDTLDALNISAQTAALGLAALAIGVVYGIAKIFSSIRESEKAEYQRIKEDAQSLREEADSLDAEADELSNLHERLVEAHSDRAKLANLYDELNRKIGVSTDLLSGEEEAYKRTNALILQQIEYNKKVASEKRKQAIDAEKRAFNKNDVDDNIIFGISLGRTLDGDTLREWARKYGPEHDWVKYGGSFSGVSKADWYDYWDEQSKTALKAYEEYVSDHGEKGFGEVGLNNAIDYFVRHGFEWDELYDETEKYVDAEAELLNLVDDYYKAYESGNGKQFADSREAIDDYIEFLKKEYPFLEEFAEKFKDSLQIGIDALDIPDTLTENQIKEKVDAYKKLIDIRKKLLKSYKEELDYQKKLAQKEKELTRLQQKYSVAILDTSAAGKARARSLAEEVTKSQEELDDITLDHAIDLITEDLDKQLEEYENLISGKLDNIQAGVDSVADVAASIAKTGLKIGTSDFWKYVETNPIAMIAQGFKSITEQVINSPLFEVTIEGNATEETVEKIEEIADVVVEKLKKGLGSLFGRTGYKGSPKPALQ